MKAVNLLPKDESRERRGLPGPWVFAAAAVPIVACSLVYLGHSKGQTSLTDKRAELASVQAQIQALSDAGSRASGQGDLVGERSQRNAALVEVLGKTMAWDVALGNLARVIPSDVWLTALTAQSPTPAGTPTVAGAAPVAAGPTAFTLQGVARSHEAVAHLVARLQLLPMLTDVTLGDISANATAAPSPQSPAPGSEGAAGGKAAKVAKPTMSFHVTATMQPVPPVTP